MQDTKSYHIGHPNPRFYRPDWQLLNGQWAFLFDDENCGIEDEYFKVFPTHNQMINVPYAYESFKSGIADKSEHNILWFRRLFSHNNEGKTTLLHIEKSDYITTVWLNGHLIGEHTGGYDAFTFDLSSYLITGNNSLVIRVFDSKDARQLRGKQTWKSTPFECFYHGTSGIYGDVWLEHVNATYLEKVELFPNHQQHCLIGSAYLSNVTLGNQLAITISYKEQHITTKDVVITSKKVDFAVDIPLPLHLWSVDDPCLYDVVFQIKSADAVLDCVLSYFGINTLGIENKKITFNEKPAFLKLVLDQGYFPGGDLTGTYEDYMTDISYLKASGFNGVRKHEKIESNLFFYLSDREGLLNWLELPSPHLFDETQTQIIENQWQRIISQHLSSPSLMAYVCYNESWGVHEIKSNMAQQAMATRLYELTKKIDSTRFVISNDGWEHTISDLLTVHNYQESKEDLIHTYQNLLPLLLREGNAKANETRMCYADGYRYHGEPIIFSEFAGIAIDSNTSEGWGYGKAANGIEDFVKKLKAQIEAIYENGNFSGYCITQLTDVYQEKNGLMDQNRNIKISPVVLKTIL